MNSKQWFTSDHHFGHKNILKYTDRPFNTVEQMDAHLVRTWNSVIGPDDEVYYLGDFVWGGTDKARHYVNQLNGRIHFLPGNHDKATVCDMPEWASVLPPIYELKVDHDRVSRLVLCHYPLREWNRQYHGAVHLYGHVHGNLDCLPGSVEVSVDCWGLKPVSLDQILERLTPFLSD